MGHIAQVVIACRREALCHRGAAASHQGAQGWGCPVRGASGGERFLPRRLRGLRGSAVLRADGVTGLGSAGRGDTGERRQAAGSAGSGSAGGVLDGAAAPQRAPRRRGKAMVAWRCGRATDMAAALQEWKRSRREAARPRAAPRSAAAPLTAPGAAPRAPALRRDPEPPPSSAGPAAQLCPPIPRRPAPHAPPSQPPLTLSRQLSPQLRNSRHRPGQAPPPSLHWLRLTAPAPIARSRAKAPAGRGSEQPMGGSARGTPGGAGGGAMRTGKCSPPGGSPEPSSTSIHLHPSAARSPQPSPPPRPQHRHRCTFITFI